MTDATTKPHPRDLRLFAYVALGVLGGGLVVIFDILSEDKLQHGTLTGALASLHAVVDHTFPVLAGALLGVFAHYFQLRRQLSAAEEAASRAEALRTRLQKVERDQAVWVLAAAVLHELNNPLHALGLLLDELADGASEAARLEGREGLVQRARAQTDRALTHLKTLRSMHSLGEPDLQRVALDRVARALAGDMGSLAREDGLVVRLECEHPVQASADPSYVRTILENLLDNSMHSIKSQVRGAEDQTATSAAGRGEVTIRVGVEDGRAIVRVLDDGPPLDAGVRATLFEPLRTTKTQGLGLGLPIARALARAMRGDLVLDDGDAKAFRLELPLDRSPITPREAP